MSDFISAVSDYAGSGTVRCHMPGHKGNGVEADMRDLYALDITELDFSDELFEPHGIIARCEEKAAALFGSKSTLISPFGATSCIQTMLKTALREGDKLIMPRTLHYSAYNAACIVNADPVIIPPSVSYKQALDGNPDAKALIICSVDYYGNVTDTGGISRLCKDRGVKLLVDNSHGAHFAFLRDYTHPLHAGADMVCDSLHKVMPTLTGGAMLHLNTDDGERAKKAMKLLCSSSPSYIIMLSIAQTVDWAAEHAATEYEKTSVYVAKLRNELLAAGFDVPDCEPCRLYIRGDGKTLNTLLESGGCKAEFFDEGGVLLMFSPCNRSADYTAVSACLCCEAGINAAQKKDCTSDTVCATIPERRMDIRTAFYGDNEVTASAASIGRTAAECIGRYPPGIPVVLPGEIITEEALRGVNMPRISVVKNV